MHASVAEANILVNHWLACQLVQMALKAFKAGLLYQSTQSMNEFNFRSSDRACFQLIFENKLQAK
jgi:hypothetical protein